MERAIIALALRLRVEPDGEHDRIGATRRLHGRRVHPRSLADNAKPHERAAEAHYTMILEYDFVWTGGQRHGDGLDDRRRQGPSVREEASVDGEAIARLLKATLLHDEVIGAGAIGRVIAGPARDDRSILAKIVL